MDGTQVMQPTRVLFSCTGVGIVNRGIETFFQEAFDGLSSSSALELNLMKGAGDVLPNEHVVWNLHRTNQVAPWLGKLLKRNAYVVEQWSSFLPIVRQIRKHKPHVIFYSDSNLGFLLYWFREWIGVPYRLLFSNGGPCHPPFVRTDCVHQVAPLYYEQAIQAGEPLQKHHLVPYGINVPRDEVVVTREDKDALRRQLNLPTDRSIVISVGAIDPNSHKRIGYLVKEIAALPFPRPYLVLLGQMPPESDTIVQLANSLLGSENFTARSVPYEQVKHYYQSADIFTLASLSEGFGRVFLEALMYGLPCFVHDHPVMRYVLGPHGTFVDLSSPGALASHLPLIIHKESSRKSSSVLQRRQYVRNKFGWPALTASYVEMFRQCSVSSAS